MLHFFVNTLYYTVFGILPLQRYRFSLLRQPCSFFSHFQLYLVSLSFILLSSSCYNILLATYDFLCCIWALQTRICQRLDLVLRFWVWDRSCFLFATLSTWGSSVWSFFYIFSPHPTHAFLLLCQEFSCKYRPFVISLNHNIGTKLLL